MSWRKRLGKVFLFAMMQLGAWSGAAITPQQIEELMKMNASAVVQVVRNENGDGGADEDENDDGATDKCPEQKRN